jgi:hypothetical protein
MANFALQYPEEPQKALTRYQQLKKRLLQKVLARIAKAEKSGESEKRIMTSDADFLAPGLRRSAAALLKIGVL